MFFKYSFHTEMLHYGHDLPEGATRFRIIDIHILGDLYGGINRLLSVAPKKAHLTAIVMPY